MRIIKLAGYKKSAYNDLYEDWLRISMYIKAELTICLTKEKEKNKFTQKELSEKLNISQGKVSNLLKGRFYGFSIGNLLNFLMKLGKKIEITVK